MFGFPDLSDADDSAAVDDIISQAQDACVLEQVSAINCSGSTDSALPTDLESRFRKLKSFPVTKSKHNPNPKAKSESNSFSVSPSKENNSRSGSSDSSDQKPELSPVRENSYSKKEVKEKSEHRSGSSDSSDGNPEFSPLRENSYRKKEVTTTAKPKQNPDSSASSPSPPRKIGCFLCSPKKDYSKKKKKKSKENWAAPENVLGRENSDELYLSSPSDLGSFSRKHQQKMLKKAIKEEQKIAREAEKIVQWAKQASARMSISDIDDDLSDD